MSTAPHAIDYVTPLVPARSLQHIKVELFFGEEEEQVEEQEKQEEHEEDGKRLVEANHEVRPAGVL